MHLNVALKRKVYHKCLLSPCPGTELLCNAAQQHFFECWGSDDSPSILFISTLPLNGVAAYVMLPACSLSFFPAVRMLAECSLSINCMFLPPSVFSLEKEASQIFLSVLFVESNKEKIQRQLKWSLSLTLCRAILRHLETILAPQACPAGGQCSLLLLLWPLLCIP